MPSEHALLSASSSHKWLHCPPSARLEAEKPDQTSEYAREGSLAHSICELKLQKTFIEKGMTTRQFNTRMNKLKKDPLYKPEMENNTEEYLDHIKQIAYSFQTPPMVVAEKRVDYSKWAPEGFGTSDCILIGGAELHVVDYKNGKGVMVSAYDNPQMKLYALGAYDAYGFLFPIHKVVLHIVQPNLNNISSFELSLEELLAWGEKIKPIAQLAYEGKGDFCQGEWCDKCFCKLNATCRKRMEDNMEVMKDATEEDTGKPKLPAEISTEEIGAILKRAMFLENWVKKLKKFALDALVAGKEIPGWKIIEGRSNRVIKDKDAAVKAILDAEYEEAVIYKPREMVALGELEKLLGKKDFEKYVGPYVEKPQGAPTLVPEDDRRPAMKIRPSAEEAFGGENKYNNVEVQ